MERVEAQVTVDLEDESDGIVLKNMARLSIVFGMHKRCSFAVNILWSMEIDFRVIQT
jgi:hypothetical protein